MSLYDVLVREVSYYVGAFYAVFLRCAFSLFSSVAFLLRSFSFPSVFLTGISDQISLVVSLGVGVLGCGDTPVKFSLVG